MEDQAVQDNVGGRIQTVLRPGDMATVVRQGASKASAPKEGEAAIAATEKLSSARVVPAWMRARWNKLSQDDALNEALRLSQEERDAEQTANAEDIEEALRRSLE